MEFENILIEERRRFTVIRDDFAIASTNELNRNCQSLLLSLPFLAAALIAMAGGFWVALFFFCFIFLFTYAFIVRSKYVITPETISKEQQLLGFTFGKASVLLKDTETGILVITNTRGGQVFSVELPYDGESFEITGFKTRETCEEILKFIEGVRPKIND